MACQPGLRYMAGASSHSTTSPCSPGLEKPRRVGRRLGGWHSGMVNAKDQDKESGQSWRIRYSKIFSKPAPIYPFPVIGIQHQVITLSRKYWIPGVTTSRKIITTAAATVLNFSLTRVSVRVWGHCRSILLAKITGTVTGRCALSVWVTVIAGAA